MEKQQSTEWMAPAGDARWGKSEDRPVERGAGHPRDCDDDPKASATHYQSNNNSEVVLVSEWITISFPIQNENSILKFKIEFHKVHPFFCFSQTLIS